jgi:hypothetical protein
MSTGQKHNKVMVDALVEYLRKNGMEPDKMPSVKYFYSSE